jgi:flagellar motor protein MotB
MAKGCKCDPHEICEECPEWIFTLADLIMCMMGLFVILWVLKPSVAPKPAEAGVTPQTDQWLETLGEIRGGFGWEPDPNSSDPVDKYIIRKRKTMAGQGEGGETTLERQGAEGTDPEVTTIRQGKQATVGGRLLFDPADATLLPPAIYELQQIADQIRGHRNIILVKGHTSRDDFPDGVDAEQKMDLSLRRAQAVADYLTTHGVEPDILRVQGCSTFEPVIQRAYTPTTQAQNRRVEVEATATLVQDRQDMSGMTAPSIEPMEDEHH